MEKTAGAERWLYAHHPRVVKWRRMIVSKKYPYKGGGVYGAELP